MSYVCDSFVKLGLEGSKKICGKHALWKIILICPIYFLSLVRLTRTPFSRGKFLFQTGWVQERDSCGCVRPRGDCNIGTASGCAKIYYYLAIKWMSDMQDFGHRASSVRALCQIICLARHKKSPTIARRVAHLTEPKRSACEFLMLTAKLIPNSLPNFTTCPKVNFVLNNSDREVRVGAAATATDAWNI